MAKTKSKTPTKVSDAENKLNFVKTFGTPKAIPKRGYYVYVITENNSICYIGKGKQYRVMSHFNNSSNQLLASKIRDNKDIFNWYILEEFEDEIECFNYEELLIRNCKKLKHKLYNVTHYSNNYQHNSFFRGIFGIFKQWENMIFEDINTPEIATPTQVADIVFSIIKDFCKNIKQIPVYKGKPINELSYYKTMEGGRVRITVI